MKIGHLIPNSNFKKIPQVHNKETLKDLDFLIVNKDFEDSEYKGKKIFLGELKDLKLNRGKATYIRFYPLDVNEDLLLEDLLKEQDEDLKLHFLNLGGYSSELENLSQKTAQLEKDLAVNREGSIEIKGLREYVVRLLGVNTLEQLVYETESLRILRHKGIKISLIYTDSEGGFLCTKNTLRKINEEEIKVFFSGKKEMNTIKKHLANVLSRPVLSNFKLYSEDLQEEGCIYALFESQNAFDESDYFLDMLKKLLFTNFVRVLQSEKLFKITSLMSQAFGQIQNTSMLIGPDYEIRVSNRLDSIGKKCFQYMFSSYEPCQNCPIGGGSPENENLSQRSYSLSEHQHTVHSSKVKDFDQNFFLHIYETQDDSLKRESIKIQRGKLQSLGLVTQALTHELNNPLTGIHELSQEMAEDFSGQIKEDLVEIHKASTRCLKIIENLKKFSSKKIEFERVNLASVIQDSLILTKALTRQTKVRLNLDDSLWISGSETLLSQLVFNIMKNSIEAMGSNGSIHIDLVKEGAKGVLTFRDSGPGFSSDLKDIRLFGTKNKDEGTGFGLFLVNEFVKLHSGSLDFGNNLEGPGAYFKIVLGLD